MAPPKTAAERLIVALDVSSASEASRIVRAVGETAKLFKVGKQLFTAEGPQVVRDLVASGRKVFLDLKFHDIPNTVGKATQEAARLGVSMLTVHAAGGSKMLKAAVEAAAGGPMILGVTVLTSFTDQDLQETGVAGRAVDQVLRLAELARTAGCGGVVTSAQETRQVLQALGTGFAIVNPGVRPRGSEAGDQARVVTPAEAMASGATHIVVGRPITAAPDPAKAAEAILAEMEEVGARSIG